MTDKPDSKMLKLNLREKFFLRVFCYPPPGKATVDENLKAEAEDYNPLELFIQSFGQPFLEAIRGKRVLDIGCGVGDQVLGLARSGVHCAFGAEVRPLYAKNE